MAILILVLRIVAAYCASAFTAALVFSLLMSAVTNTNLFDEGMATGLGVVTFIAIIIAVLTIPFALCAVGYARWKRTGGVAYYTITAALAGLTILLVVGNASPDQRLENWLALAAGVMSAAFAGFLFWALAGRALDGCR